MPCQQKTALKATPPCERVWTWECDASAESAQAVGQHGLYGPVKQIKDFYQKYLRPNAEVRTRGDALIKKYGVEPERAIGVMWRGTESFMDGRPRVPIETYFPFLDDILSNEPGLRMMCTAEEEILSPLLARYPTAFKVEEFETAPGPHRHIHIGDNPERFSTKPGFERGMQPAVMMYLFSKCRYLIKNRSTVSCIASWLSDGKIISLAHPENLGHGWDITKAEVDGKIVPLNG